MKIAIGNDHAAVAMKNEVVSFLQSLGHTVVDLGSTDPEAKDDYPDFGEAVGTAVAEKKADLGVLICGTGVGISIAANKVPGVRAAVCSEPATARLARQHNDANIISFGERIVGVEEAKDILTAFLDAQFEGGRHARRVGKITAIENRFAQLQ